MKAFTNMDEERNRQVKDDEIFRQWDKICQYLNSEQGARQVDQFLTLVQFCENPETRQTIDKVTLLNVMRKEVFGYTIKDLSTTSDETPQQQALNGLDLNSPRVKNEPVKPFFALAYFTMLLVQIYEAIDETEH